jgi:hypothetical protein
MLTKEEYEAVLAYNRRNQLLSILAQHLHYHDRKNDASIPEFDKLPRKGGLVSQQRYYGEAEAELRKLEDSRGGINQRV